MDVSNSVSAEMELSYYNERFKLNRENAREWDRLQEEEEEVVEQLVAFVYCLLFSCQAIKPKATNTGFLQSYLTLSSDAARRRSL